VLNQSLDYQIYFKRKINVYITADFQIKINVHIIADFQIKLSYETWDTIFEGDDVHNILNYF
jgi:putative sterol carrier protein